MVGHVAETDEAAFDQFAEPYLAQHARIGADRGWPRMTTTQLRSELGHGLMAVGSPETVAAKVARGVRDLGASRVSSKVQHGPIPHVHNTRSVELFGEKVVPLVKDMLAGS